MKKREVSRLEMNAIDKSRDAVIARLNASFDEVVREIDGREARLKREEKRAKLVFPDPETVGFNLPAHLVGDSADYRTKERAPGTNKDGFTEQEVSHTPTHIYTNKQAHINTHKHTFALALATNLPKISLTLPLFPFPLFSFP